MGGTARNPTKNQKRHSAQGPEMVCRSHACMHLLSPPNPFPVYLLRRGLKWCADPMYGMHASAIPAKPLSCFLAIG
jgi:hypothetical protein